MQLDVNIGTITGGGSRAAKGSGQVLCDGAQVCGTYGVRAKLPSDVCPFASLVRARVSLYGDCEEKLIFCCKDTQRATLRTRRVAASERPRSRDLLIILLFSFSYVASSSPPRVQQQNDLQSCKHKTIYAFQSHSFPPLLPPFFYITFSSSRLTLSNKHLLTQPRYHEATVCSLFTLF